MNMVTLEVANRIHMFLKNRQYIGEIVPYDEVRQLQDLPKSLATELKYQAHSHVLDAHPLWRLMNIDDAYARFFRRLSHAVTEKGLKWGDELLHVGAPAQTMFFVMHGELEYVSQARASTKVLGDELSYQWACEMALWCRWICQGQLQARGVCVVLALDAQVFHRLAESNAVIFGAFQRYGEAYTRSLNEALREEQEQLPEQGAWRSRNADPVDDCWGQASELQELTEDIFDVVIPARTTSRKQAHSGRPPNDAVAVVRK